MQTGRPTERQQARSHAVRGRAISGQFNNGSLALFPPPHRYFYPLDFSNNFKNIWTGSNVNDQDLPFGFGIRHDPDGDNRYVPWFNAPPGTTQKLGLFWLLSQTPSHQLISSSFYSLVSDRSITMGRYGNDGGKLRVPTQD